MTSDNLSDVIEYRYQLLPVPLDLHVWCISNLDTVYDEPSRVLGMVTMMPSARLAADTDFLPDRDLLESLAGEMSAMPVYVLVREDSTVRQWLRIGEDAFFGRETALIWAHHRRTEADPERLRRNEVQPES